MTRGVEAGDRAAFLAPARARLADGVPANPLRPLVPVAMPLAPIAYVDDGLTPAERFAEAAAAVGAHVRSAPDERQLRDVVAEVVASADVRQAAVSPEPECAPIRGMLEAVGVIVVDDHSPQSLARCDLGVTSAVAAVAQTGSLVLDSVRTGARALSLLPAVHLAVVPAGALVPAAGDVVRTWSGSRLNPNLVFVTGPSRSADIELQITLGVHGPRSLWIALVGPPQRAAATTASQR